MEYTTALRQDERTFQQKWWAYLPSLPNSSSNSNSNVNNARLLAKQKSAWSKALNQRYPKLKWLVLDIPTKCIALAPAFRSSFIHLIKTEGLEGLVLNPRTMTSRVFRRCKDLKYMVFGSEHVAKPPTMPLRPERIPLRELITVKVLDLSATATSGMEGWFETLSQRTFKCTRLERCRISVDYNHGLFRRFHIDFLELSRRTLVHIQIYFKWHVFTPYRPAEGFNLFNFAHFPQLRILAISAHFPEGKGILDWLSRSVQACGGDVNCKIELYFRAVKEVPSSPPQYDVQETDSPSNLEDWINEWAKRMDRRLGPVLRDIDIAIFLDMRDTLDCPDWYVAPHTMPSEMKWNGGYPALSPSFAPEVGRTMSAQK
ncbi:hypothetical protein CC1G_04023 [Coprinopsis cinerea okayama7|uniref:Uncharacterized protein n=1 Tax=Coprinopsis cinerea (strain Okayama-7 / 130 / ATCC MYA-4618 / FGSC 9003) TaxID=240176 RepID=A8N8H6_COPC7|nr:hypothetical protein CC1G_04023 [Coprinopsis cinerea okayama7\|eukprot:XP_001831132.2 hypothetical protein CC1G_04023 [Coprinopsis cinerea okayama7\